MQNEESTTKQLFCKVWLYHFVLFTQSSSSQVTAGTNQQLGSFFSYDNVKINGGNIKKMADEQLQKIISLLLAFYSSVWIRDLFVAR